MGIDPAGHLRPASGPIGVTVGPLPEAEGDEPLGEPDERGEAEARLSGMDPVQEADNSPIASATPTTGSDRSRLFPHPPTKLPRRLLSTGTPAH